MQVELTTKIGRKPKDEEVLSYVLYPKVFVDFAQHVREFGHTSVLATPNFFYGLQTGDEIAVEIERGKTLIIRYLTTGDVHEDGRRTVFFELNGQPREVRVADRSVGRTLAVRPKADPEDPSHVGAPMPGKIASVTVEKGQKVAAGDALVSIEAMKMETTVHSPAAGTVEDVLVKPGGTVEARDLLVVIV